MILSDHNLSLDQLRYFSKLVKHINAQSGSIKVRRRVLAVALKRALPDLCDIELGTRARRRAVRELKRMKLPDLSDTCYEDWLATPIED